MNTNQKVLTQRCQWMQGVMNSETSSWQHCDQAAVAEVFRSGISVGVVCETHSRATKLLGWETRIPIRPGIAAGPNA